MQLLLKHLVVEYIPVTATARNVSG